MVADAWLLDVHDEGQGVLDVWCKASDGRASVRRIEAPCMLHVQATPERLRALGVWLDQPEVRLHYGILSCAEIEARCSLEDDTPSPVVELLVRRPGDRLRLARAIDDRGWHRHHVLYSVDVDPVQAWLAASDLRLFQGVDSRTFRPQKIEDARVLHEMKVLRLEGVWQGPMLDGVLVALKLQRVSSIDFTPCEAGEDFQVRTPQGLQEALLRVHEIDPDVLLTDGGNAHLFPALRRLSVGWGTVVALGRTPDPLPEPTRRTTVHSYGRLLRRGGHHRLNGRIHIDLSTSFLGREAGLPGLMELCSASGRTLDAVARRSPGAVISAIQIQTVLNDGVLIPWRKNRPEDTTTGWDLLLADRGGLHLDPAPGLHRDVFELDFASLYPSLIATRNISPETLGCTCCSPGREDQVVPLDPDEARRWFRDRRSRERLAESVWPPRSSLPVPGLNLNTCLRRHGMLGRVVAPLIRRRRELKSMRHAPLDEADRRQKALKWLLVTCFGYTGYRNARFGRIEAHEAICAWARELMIQGVETARSEGWDVVHGIVDSLWVVDRQGRDPSTLDEAAEALAQSIGERTGVPLEVEGRYPVLAILPRRSDGAGALTRYWGCGVMGVKVRGIEARQHSTSPFVRDFQRSALEALRKHVLNEEADARSMEALLLRAHEEARERLVQGHVPLSDLLVARRVERGLEGRRSATALQRALRRSERLGWPVDLGSRIRFVEAEVGEEGLLLEEELGGLQQSPQPTLEVHLRRLDRAAWSLLGPLGWGLEALRRPAGQRRLPVSIAPEG